MHVDNLKTVNQHTNIRLVDVQTGKSLRTLLRSDRPYERMNITGATGLTPAQVAALKALDAVAYA